MKALERMDFASFDRLARKGDLVPVWMSFRADTETPVSAFRKLPSQSHALLLESAEGGERWGRFSFLADRPIAILRMIGNTSIVEEDGKRTFTEEDIPLDAARRLLARYTLARCDGLPRFVGGLVGYLGWGASRWFEPRIPSRLGPDPEFPDAEWMLVDRVSVFDNLAHQLKVISLAHLPRFASARAAYLAAIERSDELVAALDRPLPKEPPTRCPVGLADNWRRSAFERAVEKAQLYIRAGDCMQVVLSRRITGRYDGDPFELYRALRAVSPTPYLFYLRFGDHALAGASPELLVRCGEGRVTVRPIAGTRRRGTSSAEDLALEAELRSDPKERAEHVMLIDLGRNDIGRVAAPGTVRLDEREVVERYSHVMHLVSQVSGELSPGVDAFDVVRAVFPAGTVSGAPKVRAMELIDELEPVPRGPYAGAVGYIGFDSAMDLAIAIRTVALSGTEFRVQAGAGIVYDSDAKSEYEETSHKMKAALAALGVLEPAQPTAKASVRARGRRAKGAIRK